MYTVWTESDWFCDDIQIFEGTLQDCYNYIIAIGAQDSAEYYIVEPDGITVVD